MIFSSPINFMNNICMSVNEECYYYTGKIFEPVFDKKIWNSYSERRKQN